MDIIIESKSIDNSAYPETGRTAAAGKTEEESGGHGRRRTRKRWLEAEVGGGGQSPNDAGVADGVPDRDGDDAGGGLRRLHDYSASVESEQATPKWKDGWAKGMLERGTAIEEVWDVQKKAAAAVEGSGVEGTKTAGTTVSVVGRGNNGFGGGGGDTKQHQRLALGKTRGGEVRVEGREATVAAAAAAVRSNINRKLEVRADEARGEAIKNMNKKAEDSPPPQHPPPPLTPEVTFSNHQDGVRGERAQERQQNQPRLSDRNNNAATPVVAADFFPLSSSASSSRSCACARYIGEFGAAPVERGYWFRGEKVENTRARIDALCGNIYRRRQMGLSTQTLEEGEGEGRARGVFDRYQNAEVWHCLYLKLCLKKQVSSTQKEEPCAKKRGRSHVSDARHFFFFSVSCRNHENLTCIFKQRKRQGGHGGK